MNKRIFFVIAAVACIGATTFLSSCDKSEKGKDNFNRGLMLQNYANSIIIPAYTDLQSAAVNLVGKSESFVSSPSVELLQQLQDAWINAYEAWQYASAFNFGPAGEEGTQKSFVEEIGTFPVSTTKINNAISSGSFNLNDFNRDARGFLAVEYLIFDLQGNHEALVESFQDEKRKAYLTALVENIKTKTDAVTTAWNGAYKDNFISKTGIDAGSGSSLLYNEFIKSYEALKNYKVGIPVGKTVTANFDPQPDKVEAYYSGKSIQMLKLHYKGIEDIWYGRKKDGTDGLGFQEYLRAVVGGEALITSTEAQMTNIRTSLNQLSEITPLSEQVISNQQPVLDLWTELQKNTRYFKSDMSSLLGIAITYASGDGD